MLGYLSKFFVTLSAVFFVVDPIGLLPIFVVLTRNDSSAKVRATCLRACLAGALLLSFFALFGELVFRLFGVTLPAFRVAGGLLLLVTSLDMVRARPQTTRTSPSETRDGAQKEDIALVPLAIPLLAGPGAMATVMVLISPHTDRSSDPLMVLLAIALTFAASYLLLRAAPLVQRFLGLSGIAVLERVMGLLLAAIAIQFVAEGARELLQAS